MIAEFEIELLVNKDTNEQHDELKDRLTMAFYTETRLEKLAMEFDI